MDANKKPADSQAKRNRRTLHTVDTPPPYGKAAVSPPLAVDALDNSENKAE